MASDRLGWSPAVFWDATAAEMELVIEGLQGRFSGGANISREEVRRAAAAHGKKPSLRKRPH
ncbi:phage tail assembly chaperone [Agrobacterium sp. Ap1]|nr:phage tail assembly chaperone [Agrobacterium sp. Ap1]